MHTGLDTGLFQVPVLVLILVIAIATAVANICLCLSRFRLLMAPRHTALPWKHSIHLLMLLLQLGLSEGTAQIKPCDMTNRK